MSPQRLSCLWLTWMLPIQPEPGLLQEHLPATFQGSSHLPCSPEAQTGNSPPPSQAQLFQRAVLGGNELLLFSLTLLMSSDEPAVRVLMGSPLPWEGVALGFVPQSAAHRFAQPQGEISYRATQVPSTMLGSHKPGLAKHQ